MSNGILPPRESWQIKNISTTTVIFYDVPTLPGLQPQQTIEALDYTTADILGASDNYRNYLTQYPPLISTTGYLHTHDERSLTTHTHTEFNILAGGPIANADLLHTHDDLVASAELETLVSDVIEAGIDLSDYVAKSGSITQLLDITSTGEVIEAAVASAHAEAHTLLEHIDDDPFTIENFRKLLDGSNADCCHTHSDIARDHNDLDGLNVGDYIHLTVAEYAEFGTLTDGSNADSLHTHSGAGTSITIDVTEDNRVVKTVYNDPSVGDDGSLQQTGIRVDDNNNLILLAGTKLVFDG